MDQLKEETATADAGGSSSINANTPEHVIDIVNGDQTQSTLKERMAARRTANRRNRQLIRENASTYKADPKVDADDIAKTPHVRYQLQKFTNGGTPTADGGIDGKDGGPSSYEEWRYELNDKKRRARLTQEKHDLERPGRSPDTSIIDRRRTLDNQIDDFLFEYIKEREDAEIWE
jgi:hypothetical protein